MRPPCRAGRSGGGGGDGWYADTAAGGVLIISSGRPRLEELGQPFFFKGSSSRETSAKDDIAYLQRF